jgi:hypothetical protein
VSGGVEQLRGLSDERLAAMERLAVRLLLTEAAVLALSLVAGLWVDWRLAATGVAVLVVPWILTSFALSAVFDEQRRRGRDRGLR